MPTNDQPIRNTEDLHGYILGAEVYPFDESNVELSLMYYEDDLDVHDRDHKSRKFVLKKEDAQSLVKNINVILAVPDTEAAWEHVLSSVPEAHEPDWSNSSNTAPLTDQETKEIAALRRLHDGGQSGR